MLLKVNKSQQYSFVLLNLKFSSESMLLMCNYFCWKQPSILRLLEFFKAWPVINQSSYWQQYFWESIALYFPNSGYLTNTIEKLKCQFSTVEYMLLLFHLRSLSNDRTNYAWWIGEKNHERKKKFKKKKNPSP